MQSDLGMYSYSRRLLDIPYKAVYELLRQVGTVCYSRAQSFALDAVEVVWCEN